MDLSANNEIEINNNISQEIVIRTLFNRESRFIVLPSNDFSLDNYMRAGKSTIKIYNRRLLNLSYAIY